ncbi:hypothetical protein SAMN05443144_10474 [Fodinibius roseus]|uniref:Magnetosome protein MamS/MamX domain-containing protein n=1 Tax=Fodinibius roseus TaxID=1194090 RepID=A0A1M4XAE3_9BACT|nr:hypothetical protein [Fodinibius roseus]SHE90474.1 hypothetical protein SAMN05443144_10474 [Fodinibius roseus]
MDLNTKEVIRNLQLWGGGLVLLAIGGIVHSISKGVMRYKKYHRQFDPDNVKEFDGHILEIITEGSQNDEKQGVILILETENKKIIPIHLGPEWYISHQQDRLKDGQKVRVVGSRVNYEDNPAIIAARIEHGDSTLILRDENGRPRWQSWVN